MNQLGDLLFSLPVLSGARATWPQARIACVARPPLIPLLSATGFVDEVIPRHDDGLFGMVRLAGRLRKDRFERAVFFSESPGVLITGAAARIPERVGFVTASLASLLTRRAPRTGVPSMGNNRSLAAAAGIGNVPEDYCDILRIPPKAKESAALWLSESDMEQSAAVILAPGASRRRAEKHWELARWRELVRRLQGGGLSVIAVGAPREKEFLEQTGSSVYIPDGGLLHVAAMMSLSRAVVSIDSGAMHLAAAAGRPVIALFGPTDPLQVGPLPLGRHQVIKRARMDEITVDEVMLAVDRVIKTSLK